MRDFIDLACVTSTVCLRRSGLSGVACIKLSREKKGALI